MKANYYLLFFILFIGCASKKPNQNKQPPFNTDVYPYGKALSVTQSITLFNPSRNRLIPLMVSHGIASPAFGQKRKLIILSPGYGEKINDYGYLASSLADKGYFVVTIQHNLPTDPALPQEGDLYKLRRPFWDKGGAKYFLCS